MYKWNPIVPVLALGELILDIGSASPYLFSPFQRHWTPVIFSKVQNIATVSAEWMKDEA